jgi:Flp pilus assembly protein TadD
MPVPPKTNRRANSDAPQDLGKTARRQADAFFAEGVWLMSERRYEEAVAAFDKVTAVSPHDAEAFTHRALACFRSV